MNEAKNEYELNGEGIWDCDDDITLCLSVDQYGNIASGCNHCGVYFAETEEPHTKTVDYHKLTISKNRVSFTCPCHGGWRLSLNKSELPTVGTIDLR